MTGLNLILLGPPGAGKGTQAARLRDELGVTYLATGDLLRRHRAEDTALGRRAARYMTAGRLVPDRLVISMLLDALGSASPRGFLLDGFPRTTTQAEALEAALDTASLRLTAVLLIDAPDDVIVERISGRLTCPQGHVFHRQSDPPARAGICDHDGERLVTRDDDRPDTVRSRLEVYHAETEPLVAYYKSRGLLRTFDGTQPPGDVLASIRTALGLEPARHR